MRYPRPHRQKQPQRGFTLLLAALVSSIVLLFGSSIFSIAQKQITLSSMGKDSQFAFYAADTGAECALYYDIIYQAFPKTSPQTAMITCDKNADGSDNTVSTVVTATSGAGGTSWVSSFSLDLFARDVVGNGPSNAAYCVQVSVSKNPIPPYTVIHADGYSAPCSGIDASARTLQRSVELQY